ncbi:MAG: glycosyltransferase [Opitutaceae bacterium]
MPRKRICLVCTEPATFDAFLAPHAARLRASYDLSLAANGRPRTADAVGIDVHLIRMERAVAPWRDLTALQQLEQLFRSERFDAVHSFTPKAGLLAMLAARRAGVRTRMHTFTGQVWATKRGLARWFLQQADRRLARAATHLLADSPSQAEFLAAQQIVPRERIAVIGDGSICGVNLGRFKPDAAARREVRGDLGVPDGACLFLFLGRLKRDKGVFELAQAFCQLAAEQAHVQLAVVGPDEENLRPALQAALGACAERARFVAMTPQPERFLAAADVLCLPSHREGFGNVILEAAACGCPAVASKIYGVTDAIEDGRTGWLHPPGDVGALSACMARLADAPETRAQLASSARARAERLFSEWRITEGLAEYYANVFKTLR